MPYLMEVTGCHRTTKALRVFRFTDLPGGYNTGPSDMPADTHYAPRINQPGNYSRTLFGSGGRTSGVAQVDRGLAELNNIDGRLDEMRDYAFDGYDMVISAIALKGAAFASRVPVLKGTVEQIEVTWDQVRLRLRSRLAILDVPIQTATYAGTTTDGTKIEAEGGEDLKKAPKSLIFGSPPNVPAILVNRWSQIYQVGQRFDAILRVRDKGAVLTFSGQDFATIAALRSATIPGGQYATAKALGLIRIGGNVAGQVTVDAVEGATPAARTAGQVVRRILIEQAGLVPGTDFLEADITALDAAAPYEVEVWTGTTNPTTLAIVSSVLDSVGGWISPDRLGTFRIGRFRAPGNSPVKIFDRLDLLEEDGIGIQRLATGDEGNGVPAKKVTVRHSRNYAVASENELAGTVIVNDGAFVSFAKEEWRQEESSSAAIAEVHKLASEIEFETHLVKAADAKAIADERLALYGAQRDRYSAPVRASLSQGVDLSHDVGLRLNRFGLDEGGTFIVTGMVENLGDNTAKLDLWG